MVLIMILLCSDTNSVWKSAVYKAYEDLKDEYYNLKLSNKFSKEYCNNLKKIYGGKVLAFEGIDVFLDVDNNIKIGIEHSCYIDTNDRVYDPFLGYFDIDLSTYLRYIGYHTNNNCSFSIV